jgi:hypothetical protein
VTALASCRDEMFSRPQPTPVAERSHGGSSDPPAVDEQSPLIRVDVIEKQLQRTLTEWSHY